MRKTIAVLAWSAFLGSARADIDTISPIGIDSKSLGLSGSGAVIGQVESGRPGKPTKDAAQWVHNLVVPTQVYAGTGVDQANSQFVMGDSGRHALWVAGVMIATSTQQNSGLEGVAPAAVLHSAAASAGGGDETFAITANSIARIAGMRAINVSTGRELDGLEEPNGDSYLTRFVDWSARAHNVLYVIAGSETSVPNDVPMDNYNGLTVAASQTLNGGLAGRFRQVAPFNISAFDADGARTSVDLMAPGNNIDLTDRGSGLVNLDGTSLAAPHVTGTVALLQQHAESQILLPDPGWDETGPRRHEVMKAVLLNTADKLVNVHGSARDVVNKPEEGAENWLTTTAFTSPFVTLDERMGAGHLNASAAFTNFKTGEYEAGVVPRIGWDYGFVGLNLSKDYIFDQPVSGYVSATLAWDRRWEKTGDEESYSSGDQFFNPGLVDLDIYLLPAASDDLQDAIAASQAFDDSVEHIFFNVPEEDEGMYKIRVVHAGGLNDDQDFGLAWWAGEVAIGDFDDDRDVDGADLNEWKMDFALNGNSDADQDGDSDGNDFIAWQRNVGTGVSATPAGAPVPEPGACLLCCLALPFLRLGRRGMTRRSAALLVLTGVGMVTAKSASAADITVSRNSRSVTSAEIAGGAPADGMVHDFFVTSDSDLLSLVPDIDVPLYQHEYGDDQSAPHPALVALFPALGTDSFLRFPGSTVLLGDGFAGTGPETVWGDLSNNGPQSNFLFGRLTTTEAGTFSGHFSVSGASTFVNLPFTVSLPGPGEGLRGGSGDEQVSISVDEPVELPPPPPAPKGPDAGDFTPADFKGTVSIELTRRSRPVSEKEQAFGAPDGFVHDFFVTSSTDLISIGNVDIEGATYQHPRGSDRKPPNDRVLRLWPASSADSFLTTPGVTAGLGKGFYGTKDAEIVWFDQSDDGPLDEFQFARLTTDESGSFAGDINVRGPEGRVTLPFKFSLPGTEGDLALLDGEQTYRMELSFGELAAGQVPEPSAWMLCAAGLLMLRRRAALFGKQARGQDGGP